MSQRFIARNMRLESVNGWLVVVDEFVKGFGVLDLHFRFWRFDFLAVKVQRKPADLNRICNHGAMAQSDDPVNKMQYHHRNSFNQIDVS